MSFRLGLRFFSRPPQLASPLLRTKLPRPQRQIFRHFQRRAASIPSSAAASASPAAPQSLLQRLWTSEIGVKTVHFWAPVMKWALVIAGVSDFFRPVESLSLTQNFALTATGSIWTRWCLIIKPKNYLLAAVNFCLAIVGVVQVSRILTFQSAETPSGSLEEAVEVSKEKEKEALEGVKEDVKQATAAVGR